VQPRFLRAPVVTVAPVVHQLAHVGDRGPVLPAAPLDLVREPGPRQAEPEILEGRVVDVDAEPLDVVPHGALLARAVRLFPPAPTSGPTIRAEEASRCGSSSTMSVSA